MGNRLDDLKLTIRGGLAGLPEEAAGRALDYYGEYIAEALEAGRSEEEILKKLGRPEEIIALVKAEASLDKAEMRPGPFRLIGATRKVFRSIVTSAARVSLLIGAAVPYTLALGLYIASGAAVLGALGAVALMIDGISGMSAGFVLEKIGAAGVAVFAAAVFAAAGLGLWLAANRITRLTLRVLRRSLKRDWERGRDAGTGQTASLGLKKAFLICVASALLGIVLIIPSGLPMRYFSIWNSMRPGHLTAVAGIYNATDISEIEATTLNSRIVVRTGAAPSESIRVIYEKPDWMANTLALHSKRLIFREISRGMLPFLGFIARHEGMTAVMIEVPPNYAAKAVQIQSTGGHISVDLQAGSIRVKTGDGNIRFSSRGWIYNIKVYARKGSITVKGRLFDGGVYASGAGEGHIAELRSSGGKIEID